MKWNLRRRIENLEQWQRTNGTSFSTQFDKDALTIYLARTYLNARMEPDYGVLEATSAYTRGKAIRNKIYGPIIPSHLNERLRRYTIASGEFELAFGREPDVGDILLYDHILWLHRCEIYCHRFEVFTEAWMRQLPHLPCPLKFEDGRLLKRLSPRKIGADLTWEEDFSVKPDARWFSIPEIKNCDLNDGDRDGMTAAALIFIPRHGGKHQCRPAMVEEVRRANPGPPTHEPTWLRLGEQNLWDSLRPA
jgi:hypothetical protein